MTTTGSGPHVVIVGGGISGLAAAFFLREAAADGVPARVTVLEGSPRLGGKLIASEVAGVPVDEGAEALLARRREGTDLITAAGLGDGLVPAGTTSSAIWTRGAMRPLPRRQFMGVPADMSELAATGVVSPVGVDRARHEARLHRDGDISVAGYIGGALGAEVVDRLVDPLLGGVYAGRSEDLSFDATLAPLAVASRKFATITEAAASLLPPAPLPGPGEPGEGDGGSRGPVFVTLESGLGVLPELLAKASGAEIRTSAMVRELTRTPGGWRLVTGSAADPEHLEADAVILACPATPAARLLSGVAPAAASALGGIPYASMAIITLAFPASACPIQWGPDRTRPGGYGGSPPRVSTAPETARSGYLVPAVDGKAVKAVTFSTVKWPHLARAAGAGDPVHIVRCSVGRIGEVAVLQRDDEDLVALATAELAEATGITAGPVDSRVTRWGGGLPQYNVRHLDRVATIRAAVARHPGLAVAGAAYDGVGIPACVGGARAAAMRILAQLTAR
jgi:oxygen-dependent protoporphyrinogen oxidase